MVKELQNNVKLAKILVKCLSLIGKDEENWEKRDTEVPRVIETWLMLDKVSKN